MVLRGKGIFYDSLAEDNLLLRKGILDILVPFKNIIIIAAPGSRKNMSVKKANVILPDPGLRSQNSLLFAEIAKKDFPEAKIIIMDLAPVKVIFIIS